MSAKSRGENPDFTIDMSQIARAVDRALVRFMQMALLVLALVFLLEPVREYSAVLAIATVLLAGIAGILESFRAF